MIIDGAGRGCINRLARPGTEPCRLQPDHAQNRVGAGAGMTKNDGSVKVRLLRYASSFVVATYCKYDSLLKIRPAKRESFLRNRLFGDFLRGHQALTLSSFRENFTKVGGVIIGAGQRGTLHLRFGFGTVSNHLIIQPFSESNGWNKGHMGF